MYVTRDRAPKASYQSHQQVDFNLHTDIHTHTHTHRHHTYIQMHTYTYWNLCSNASRFNTWAKNHNSSPHPTPNRDTHHSLLPATLQCGFIIVIILLWVQSFRQRGQKKSVHTHTHTHTGLLLMASAIMYHHDAYNWCMRDLFNGNNIH